jgi:hypothetical protein
MKDHGIVEEVNSCMIYLIHCKNLCKCHNIPTPSTIIKEEKRMEFEMVESAGICRK